MPTRFPLVVIAWEDAEHDGAWSSVEDETQHELGLCTSVGWIIHENEKRLILAASISQTEIGNKQIIPVKMITKRKILKKAQKSKSVRIPKGDGGRDNKSTEPVDRVGKVTVDKPAD